MLKDYLKEKGTSFTEKLVDLDEKAKEELSGLSGGFFGVPFTLVTFDDGRKETIVGFDKGKLEAILQISQ
jgi:hypothetical protein